VRDAGIRVEFGEDGVVAVQAQVGSPRVGRYFENRCDALGQDLDQELGRSN
jgi:hypothetical protein